MDVDPQWISSRDQNINSEIKFLSIDEIGVGEISILHDHDTKSKRINLCIKTFFFVLQKDRALSVVITLIPRPQLEATGCKTLRNGEW